MKELLILIEYLNKKLIFLLKAKDNLIRKYLTLEILFNLYIYIFNLRSCFFFNPEHMNFIFYKYIMKINSIYIKYKRKNNIFENIIKI
jgi:hypothetical protein